ncbi:MAG: hypothetical protein JJE22_16195 [Bacteroidia bacterium]|nr:hypothetical protein [Bacteroidia bacterium]
MKRRVRKIANFFAFNLLFFALYLNFIHKDKAANAEQGIQTSTAAFSGTVLVDNPEKYIDKKNEGTTVNVQEVVTEKTQQENTALKLSIN